MSRGKTTARPVATQASELKRLAQSVGQGPGLISIDPSWPPPRLRLMAYGPDDCIEEEVRVDQIPGYLDRWPVVWVNVDGLGDETVLRALGEIFELHRLALEDVVNLEQRAKVEAYDEDLFIVARTPEESGKRGEQLTLFVGRGYLLSFQERSGDSFDGVRDRIRHGKGRIRTSGVDYLAYALLDAVIDSYFPVIEAISESLEEIEADVLASPDKDTVGRIYEIKRRLLVLRRNVWPHREALGSLIRDSHSYFTQETGLYLRDTYDHCLRIADLVESLRDLCSDLMSTYLSLLSNRMNEVMKVLSIIGTVFIPLGFLAGLYGMNFDREASPFNMPELGWYFGYPFALLLMGSVALGLLIYFWRKGWFR